MEITKKHKDFPALRFCCDALDFNKTDHYAHVVCIKDEKCTATDGLRLFVAACSLPNGVYDVIKNTRQAVYLVKTDDNISFPDYKLVVYDFPDTRLCTITFGRSKSREANINKLIKSLPQDIGIDTTYLKPLEGRFDVFYNMSSPKSPIFLKRCDRMAIIMPMNLKNI